MVLVYKGIDRPGSYKNGAWYYVNVAIHNSCIYVERDGYGKLEYRSLHMFMQDWSAYM